MQLFLTADSHSTANDISNHVDLSKGSKLAFIDTAAEPDKDGDDIQWLINDRKALVDAGFDVSDYTITGKNKEEIEEYLSEFDHIYCSGGDTAYLLNQSYLTGFIEVIKNLVLNQDKTYIGSSAGSIIAGPRLPVYLQRDDLSELNEKPAFEFVNFTIVPHWGSQFFKKMYLEERLERIYREDQVPFILLTNTQYIHVKDDFIKIIDLGSE